MTAIHQDFITAMIAQVEESARQTYSNDPVQVRCVLTVEAWTLWCLAMKKPLWSKPSGHVDGWLCVYDAETHVVDLPGIAFACTAFVRKV